MGATGSQYHFPFQPCRGQVVETPAITLRPEPQPLFSTTVLKLDPAYRPPSVLVTRAMTHTHTACWYEPRRCPETSFYNVFVLEASLVFVPALSRLLPCFCTLCVWSCGPAHPAVFVLSVLWRAAEPLWRAACLSMSLPPVEQPYAGSAVP